MTAIEIFALIVAVLAAIKILVILINPRSWYDYVVKTVYSKPSLTIFIALILSAIVLNYLLAEINIVQIFAVMLLLMLLTALSFAIYSKETLGLARKMLKDKTLVKKAWLAILVWVVLIIWVLYTLFA